MWAIYLDAVREHLPQARVLFDRFHVVQHLNRAVDEVRRDAWRKLSGAAKVAFKRTRWLWLKNPWNLKTPEKLSAVTILDGVPVELFDGRRPDGILLLRSSLG
jgi:transposase